MSEAVIRFVFESKFEGNPQEWTIYLVIRGSHSLGFLFHFFEISKSSLESSHMSSHLILTAHIERPMICE